MWCHQKAKIYRFHAPWTYRRWQIWSRAVAITLKMDAKKNDRNEHEQKKRPLTSTPLCSRPHSLLFLRLRAFYFLRRYWLASIWQISKAVGKLFDFYHLESKAMATSATDMVSYKGQKKLGPRPRSVSFRGFNSNFPTTIPNPFICGVPHPGYKRWFHLR